MSFHGGLNFALAVALALGFPLVMLLLALGQADFTFDAAFAEVQVERHQGITGTLHLADQFADFGSVEQQLSGARGFRMDVG